jgi:hypothetical protein
MSHSLQKAKDEAKETAMKGRELLEVGVVTPAIG